MAAAACITACGCQHAINPFVDDLPAVSEITTASVTGARAAPRKEPAIPRREFNEVQAWPESGTVDHWPLWWEDPFEDKGSVDDREFKWTEEDYFAVFYGPGRFILNTMAFPVSAWVTKPGTVTCSDGQLSRQALGYDHDAAPCPGGTALPIDILEIGTYPEEPIVVDMAEPQATEVIEHPRDG
jgi:hypothetical protein